MSQFTGFIQNEIKQGHRSLVQLAKASGTATTANQILAKTTGGVVIPATSATVRSQIEGVCNQTISSGDALTQVPVIEIFENDTWIADTTNNTNAAHNYQRMVLTDSLTVNNTGTDDPDGVVEQVRPFGDPSDKKAIFKFV